MSYKFLKLKDETKRNVERHLGLSTYEIKRMTIEELDNYIARRIGREEIPIGYSSLLRLVSREETERRLR
jgi:hypothetical protein